MTRDEDQILKITKEIVVKFIEIGRVSPTQLDGVFQNVFRTVKSCVSLDESD
jgi:predicted transcriptional regulator